MHRKTFITIMAFIVVMTCFHPIVAQETPPAEPAPAVAKPEAAKETPPAADKPVEPKKPGGEEDGKKEGPGMGSLAGTVPKTEPAATPAPADPVFTNADVIKLTGVGMGNDVIISKINTAKQVAFKVDTDDLVALKSAGVTQDVISAMVTRSSSPIAVPGGGTGGAMARHGDEDFLVRLVTKDKSIDLTSVAGSTSVAYAFVTMLTFMDYPNLKAEVRIRDRRPYILVESGKSPQGRIFLVKCEADDDDNKRSVKVGKSGMFTAGGFGAPDTDEDWTVPVDVKAVQPGLWRIDPKKDLKPGEYGVWGPGAELYDFGVDK